ncbi:MAG: FimV/HubP family polar landmark protein [Plesiomonas sp.]|uniref:FimV/HubP family polar landmark protein n=1 Tax=Plesiomonas sp. TaxID=2486279 RepID=UPI003F412AD8
MTTTKIARFIAIAVLSGTVLPVGAYQMPVVGPDSAPLVATSAPARLTQPAPIPHTTRTRTPATYGPTRSNETLWSIASRVRPSNQVSVQQTIGALYRLNPSAFENNNLHGLQAGSRLRIPTLAQVRAERTSVIASRLDREKPLWEAYSREKNQPQQALNAAPNTADATNTASSPKAQSNSQNNSKTSLGDAQQPSDSSATKSTLTGSGSTPVTDINSTATAAQEALTPAVTSSEIAASAVVPVMTTPATTTDKSAGNLADRYQQANTGALTTGTATTAGNTTEENTTEPATASTAVPAVSAVKTPDNTVVDKKVVGQGSASAVIPLTVAASMATRALDNPSEDQTASGNTTLSPQATQPNSVGDSPEEQLKHLRQQLVESNAEITLLAEKNLKLNNQVSALSIEMKSLQATLAEGEHFRQEAATRLTQADLQAKQLAELQVKYDKLESSSASLTYQMAKSWPVAIAVGVIPPTIIGFLLWVLYRVRQRKQQDMLSQAFEEHKSKTVPYPDSVNLLAEETPDLNRSDELLIDPDWNAITASDLSEHSSSDATVVGTPLADATQESKPGTEANSHTVLLDDSFTASVPDSELTDTDAQTLPEPPSLFAGLDESIYAPSALQPETDSLSSEMEVSSEAHQASAKANKPDGASESASFPEAAFASAMLAPKAQESTAESQTNHESQELASLVDNDLAHGDMLGGEQNLELEDDIVNVMLSTPTRQHGSPLDLDDDVHLLADSNDDTDSVLLLSDEELFESALPLQSESANPVEASSIPTAVSDALPNSQSEDLTSLLSDAVPAPIHAPAVGNMTDRVEAQTHRSTAADFPTETAKTDVTDTEIVDAESTNIRNTNAVQATLVNTDIINTDTSGTEASEKTAADADTAETVPTFEVRQSVAAIPTKTPLFDLPDMTEADFDLSTPLLPQAEHWSMPLPPEPQSEHEDWGAQPNLMADQLSPEERDGVTQPFVRALHTRQPVAEDVNHDEDMTDDLVGKLILARAYLDIDDPEGAVALLNEVIAQGSESQQQQARKMLQEVTSA